MIAGQPPNGQTTGGSGAPPAPHTRTGGATMQTQIITVVDMPAGIGLTDQGVEAGGELRPFVRPANCDRIFVVDDRVDVVVAGAILSDVTILEIVTNKGGWVYVDASRYGGYGFDDRIGVAPGKVRAPR